MENIDLCRDVAEKHSPAPPGLLWAYQAWRRTLGPRDLARPEDYATQRPFREKIDAYNGDKVFGVTNSGLVGVFPHSVLPGDRLYILFGGDWPFLLREMDRAREFQLVGQCYVHGIMRPGDLNLHDLMRRAEDVHLCGPFETQEELMV